MSGSGAGPPVARRGNFGTRERKEKIECVPGYLPTMDSMPGTAPMAKYGHETSAKPLKIFARECRVYNLRLHQKICTFNSFRRHLSLDLGKRVPGFHLRLSSCGL